MSLIFKVNNTRYYIPQFPPGTPQPEIWMRSVDRHLKDNHVTLTERHHHFLNEFRHLNHDQQEKYLNGRYARERSRTSNTRITYTVTSLIKLISTQTAHKRAHKRQRRTTKKLKAAHVNVNRAVAALICYGVLKSGGKYESFRRIHKAMAPGEVTYNCTTAQYPTLSTVKDLAYAVYQHPELLANIPDWVLRYRKGHEQRDLYSDYSCASQ